MNITPSSIPDVVLIEPKVFKDDRGFFMVPFEAAQFAQMGINAAFVQDNHSGSRQGTLRGLHYQIQHTQGKLVRVIAGEIFDVAVDLRLSSPTFGKWVGHNLTAENRHILWVPPYFAHGFLVTSEWAEIEYKITDFYDPDHERCVLWNDPDLGISWPVMPGITPTLSAKDARGKRLSEAELFS
jgi:dTDP-4-dehydrorhamnose 3,5-epimerase